LVRFQRRRLVNVGYISPRDHDGAIPRAVTIALDCGLVTTPAATTTVTVVAIAPPRRPRFTPSAVTVTAPSLAPSTVSSIHLRAGRRRTHPGSHLGLRAQPPKQALLRLLDDLDLGVLLVDSEFVEG
jgi:hypothetical protein